MAKFTLEVEIDDIEEGNIDEYLTEGFKEDLKRQLLSRSVDKAVQAVEDAIASKVAAAEEQVQNAVDTYVANVCAERFENMLVATKESDWSNKVNYVSMPEYIGQRFQIYLTEKRFDKEGNPSRWSSDAKPSAMDLMGRQFFAKEVDERITEMIRKARADVEVEIVKGLEAKLKENLAADMIKKMNIPEVLRKLQENGGNLLPGNN